MNDKKKPGNPRADFKVLDSALIKKINRCHAKWERRKPEQVLHPVVDIPSERRTQNDCQGDPSWNEEHERDNHRNELRISEKVLQEHGHSQHAHSKEPKHHEENARLAKLYVFLIEEENEDRNEDSWENHPDTSLHNKGQSIDPGLASHDFESFFHLGLTVLDHLDADVVA